MSAPQTGISGYDVARYARQLERDFHGHIHWDFSLPVREGGNAAFNVRVSFVRTASDASGGHYERGISSVWPSNEARTISGLLFRLTVELDKRLSDDLHEAERTKQDRLPF